MQCSLFCFCVIPHLSYVFSISSHVLLVPLSSRRLVPLLPSLVSPWLIPCCPTPSLLTMLTKTPSPPCFPSFFTRGIRYPKLFTLFYLQACSRPVFSLLGASHAKGPPCFRWHPTINRYSIPLCTYIPAINPPFDIAFLFSLPFYFFPFPSARPQCKSASSCYQYSKRSQRTPRPTFSDCFPTVTRPVGTFISVSSRVDVQ